MHPLVPKVGGDIPPYPPVSTPLRVTGRMRNRTAGHGSENMTRFQLCYTGKGVLKIFNIFKTKI